MEADGSQAVGSSSPDELLRMPLRQNEALQVGQLANGLRYVLMPNRSPPSRFEAHLEIHAGSGAACFVCMLCAGMRVGSACSACLCCGRGRNVRTLCLNRRRCRPPATR